MSQLSYMLRAFRRFIAPISKINAFIDELADGNMTIRIDEKSAGQLGSIASALNHTASSWQEVLNKVVFASNEVTQYAQQLSSGAQQTNMATSHISEVIEEVLQVPMIRSKESAQLPMSSCICLRVWHMLQQIQNKLQNKSMIHLKKQIKDLQLFQQQAAK
ncbi:HAMP domain-containing protein [Sporosarcina globispora]|uniref:HAMP domain-containing protein n=1 Tax=Sporosarcina globispora TaxID=1459 RepID=UPI000A918C74|nr:methyl-accepting chemotaxis protein [Sporosarcina globispora]